MDGAGETCEMATVIAQTPYIDEGTTEAFENDYAYMDCPEIGVPSGQNAADGVYVITPEETGIYRFELDATWDPTLYIVTDCANINDSCVEGDHSLGRGEVIERELEADTDYYVIIDGWDPNEEGEYRLTVRRLETTEHDAGGLPKDIVDDGYDGSLTEPTSVACGEVDVASTGFDKVDKVTLEVGIEHTFVSDLTMKLQSPAGTTLILVSRPTVLETADDGTDDLTDGHSEADLSKDVPIGFDDDSCIGCGAENMGFTLDSDQVVCKDAGACTYYPEPNQHQEFGAGLSDFIGESAVGTWKFCVGDSFPDDPAPVGEALHAFSLTLRRRQ
jgi:subtilisin-like proprotein convertase family protein